MLAIEFTEQQINIQIEEIKELFRRELRGRQNVVIAVSGGLDSDVVARLAYATPSIKKIKLFCVLQRDMDPIHLQNARELAQDLGNTLVEVALSDEPFRIIKALQIADHDEVFHSDGLDAMRMKCSLRTCLYSFYQDHGYIVLGTSNRTEFETGFFLPFGDGIAHIKPIKHLYKSQVRQIAQALGVREQVMKQPASAGFWLGEEDMEDLAWWLFNEKPITEEIISTKEEDAYVEQIKNQLSTKKIDQVLLGLSQGIDLKTIEETTNITEDVICKFMKLISAAKEFKHRGYNKSL